MARPVGLAAALFLVALLAALLYLSTVGFPVGLREAAMRRMSRGRHTWEADAIRLDPPDGIMLTGFRIYQKRVVGPPLLEARDVEVRVSPAAALARRACLRTVRVAEARLRPEMARPAPGRRRPPRAHESFALEVERSTFRGVDLSSLRCRVELGGDRTRCTDLKAALAGPEDRRGTVRGSVGADAKSGVLSGRLTVRMDPHLLLPLLESEDMHGLCRLVERFEFNGQPARFEGAFKHAFREPRSLDVDGKVWLEDFAYRGVSALRADAGVNCAISVSNATLTVDPLLLVRRGGLARGGFVSNGRRGELTFEGVSTLHPPALAAMLGVDTNGVLARCHFLGPVSISAQGRVGTRDRRRTDFQARVSGRGMGMRGFVSEDCSFALHVLGLTNEVADLRARLYGGALNGSATFVQPSGGRSNVAYDVTAELVDADFTRIMAALEARRVQDYRGRASGSLHIAGEGGEAFAATAMGDGSIIVKDGQILRLPLFGGLSKYVGRLIPGVSFFVRQTDATCEFVINNSRVFCEKVRIEGDLLSLQARGDYYLDHRLDFDVELRLLKQHTLAAKVLRIPTSLLSKLFEFRLVGTVDAPQWYPVNFSTDLLRNLGLTDERPPPESEP